MTTATDDFGIEEQPTDILIGQAPPADDAPPVHLARCAECCAGARYRTVGESGVAILERIGVDAETNFGVGPNQIPECPNGHGEMQLADEQLSAAEAFTLAQERLEAEAARPTRLPFPTPPFNYEAAIHSIFETRREVARLEVKLADADDRRKKAKAALDEANDELGELIDKFQDAERDRINEVERKQADIDAGHPDGTNLIRCKWEEQHPGQVCPICSDQARKAEHVIDSEAHVEDVAAVLDADSAVAVSDALEAFGILIQIVRIQRWTEDERAAVKAYAESAGTADRPKVLGTCHVAGEVKEGDPQCCTQCDTVLIDAGPDANFYAEGILIGTDCPGKAKAEGHHYPEKKKRASRKRQSAGE